VDDDHKKIMREVAEKATRWILERNSQQRPFSDLILYNLDGEPIELETPMDKYAVVTDPLSSSSDNTKTAAPAGTCPGCSRQLSREEAQTRWCPNCGTEPWETRSQDSRRPPDSE